MTAVGRAFINGTSNSWHGDTYTQTQGAQREKVGGKVV